MIHVYPIKDLANHNLDDTRCVCKPNIKIENNEIVIIHNSFDKREIGEELDDILWKSKIIKRKKRKPRDEAELTGKQKLKAISFYLKRIEFLIEISEDFKKAGNADLVTANFFEQEIEKAKIELMKLIN